jgi:hypothetical protein
MRVATTLRARELFLREDEERRCLRQVFPNAPRLFPSPLSLSSLFSLSHSLSFSLFFCFPFFFTLVKAGSSCAVRDIAGDMRYPALRVADEREWRSEKLAGAFYRPAS